MAAARALALQRSATSAARNKDSLLRDAISLYHLSPSFYPIASSSRSSSDTDFGARLDHSIRADIFGGNTNRIEDPCRSELLPRFLGGIDLVRRLKMSARAGPQDGSFVVAATGVAPRLTALNRMTPTQTRLSFTKRSSSAQKPQEPRPKYPGDQGPAQRSIQPGSSGAVRTLRLDERSARIRDAFFGTVEGGERPGLEVIRERTGKQAP